MSVKLLISLGIIIILFLIIKKFPENFANYLSVVDNRDLYVRFLDYLHGGYQLPDAYRRGYIVLDRYGYPHYLDYRSDPYLLNLHRFPTNLNYQGHIWHQPHNRKIIKI
jgi:hypothetical protein|tara:strand:- start:264 stop:590 length:327 start_codon:yes stop_codon:yes gene_type:complete